MPDFQQSISLTKISDDNVCYITLGDINFGSLMWMRIDNFAGNWNHYTRINQLTIIALCNSIYYHVSRIANIPIYDYECAATNICMIKLLLLPSLVIHNSIRKYRVFVRRNNTQCLIIEHVTLLHAKIARRIDANNTRQ